MTIELAKHVVIFLNTSPPNSGLSKTYIPRVIMTVKALDWKKICKLHFRAYTQVHKDRNVKNRLEDRTQGAICLGPTGNLQGAYNFFSLRSGKKITRVQLIEVPTCTIVMKRVTAIALVKKWNKRLIFENRTGATVKDILPDDKANEAFNKIDGNIGGVDWEPETQDPAEHMPQLNNNQYAALAGDEDDEEIDTKSTGVENNIKITGVRHDNEITGVGNDKNSTGVKSESGSTVATDKADVMALIEETISEAERDIVEGTDLLAGTETKTEDTQNKNVIHPYLQIPTVEHN